MCSVRDRYICHNKIIKKTIFFRMSLLGMVEQIKTNDNTLFCSKLFYSILTQTYLPFCAWYFSMLFAISMLFYLNIKLVVFFFLLLLFRSKQIPLSLIIFIRDDVHSYSVKLMSRHLQQQLNKFDKFHVVNDTTHTVILSFSLFSFLFQWTDFFFCILLFKD